MMRCPDTDLLLLDAYRHTGCLDETEGDAEGHIEYASLSSHTVR